MLPLRLHMENFGSFRAPATVDFHDVDYFVLVGPTGAGKSTVIDAICFALYGTVPRWAKENVVALALAPSATSGKVALVFESAGRRYGVVRVLARNAKGTVGSREMRLDELDPAVDPGADIEELLGAIVRPLAEGEQVTTEVQRLTGLEYRFFTQCVILPQGRFADFLHSLPNKRQDLLVQLLDAEIYERIRQRAVSEQDRATTLAQSRRHELDALTDADEPAELAATNRRDQLRAVAAQARNGIEDLRARDGEVIDLKAQAATVRTELTILDALAMPAYVPTLATRLRAANEETIRLADEADRREEARTNADHELTRLGDKAELVLVRQAHEDHRRITSELDGIQTDLTTALVTAGKTEDDVGRATVELENAEARVQRIGDLHAAVTIAGRLVVGEPCPVCLHTVAHIPQHEVPADLDEARREVANARQNLEAGRERHRMAERDVLTLEHQRTERQERLAESAGRIRAHPDFDALHQRLNAIESAERRAEQLREEARTARRAHTEAVRREDTLRGQLEEALRELDAARDTVVAFGAPPLDRSDPHAAWTTLLTWRDQDTRRRRTTIGELDRQLGEASRARDEAREGLRGLLAAHGIPSPATIEADAIGDVVNAELNRAENRLERVRDNRRRAATLTEQVRAHEQDARVAHDLTLRLRANNFEKWLCSEALELLVAVASDTLRDLSDGQFELALSDKSDIEVIDYAEAGMRRSVRTLSGGETFQASLALALALSDQVTGMGATAARSLDSIFLDEGFGTLDPATLDTVATTLDRLSGGDRMVGLVTHVPALANRVPVRFEVSRDAAGSRLEKKTT